LFNASKQSAFRITGMEEHKFDLALDASFRAQSYRTGSAKSPQPEIEAQIAEHQAQAAWTDYCILGYPLAPTGLEANHALMLDDDEARGMRQAFTTRF
jgi:hypothetical protein